VPRVGPLGQQQVTYLVAKAVWVVDGARAFASTLDSIGGLRPPIDADRAAAICELLMDPLPYRRLVLLRGWTPEDYTELLQRTASAALNP
jgi:hypothetical protein